MKARASSNGKRGGFRKLVLNLHLYVSLAFGVLLVPIALTGAPLVWRDDVDRALDPGRYAVTGENADRTPSAYFEAATAAAGPGQRAVEVRYPDTPGSPVRVTTRAPGADGKPARSLVVFLDPPTGAVLGVVGLSDSVVGVLHNFHHMLNAPQFSGRQIVGWVGVAMLIVSLSGLYLWWPRNGDLVRAMRWRRTPSTIANLHQLLGFWICVPLAVVSLTGVYLSFPRQAHALMSSLASVSAPMRHGGYGATPLQTTRLDADGALELALEQAPGSKLLSMSTPVEAKADHADHGHDAPSWRMQILRPLTGSEMTIVVSDRSGDVRIMPPPLAGDRAARWIAWIHEGRRGGPIWASIVFLAGVFPLLLLATGLVMWLRSRARKSSIARRGRDPSPLPAE